MKVTAFFTSGEDQNVGGGLLPNAVCQSKHLLLIHRIRDQARSHI
jgi:hypothetical protein